MPRYAAAIPDGQVLGPLTIDSTFVTDAYDEAQRRWPEHADELGVAPEPAASKLLQLPLALTEQR